MKRKLIYSFIFLCLISLFAGIEMASTFAADKNEIVGDNTKMGNMVEHVDNGIDHTKNAVKDMGEGAKNIAKDTGEHAKNMAEDMGDEARNTTEKIGNGMKDAGNRMIDVSKDAGRDVKEADASSATFMGIKASTWIWMLMIIIAILIIVLIVKCVTMKNDKHDR